MRASTSAVDEGIDYSDIEARYEVEAPDGDLSNIIVVDGVPIIDRSKLEKLRAKIAKEFCRKGVNISAEDIYVPWASSEEKSQGFVFIECASAEDTAVALIAFEGYPFDSKHSFQVNLFLDIVRFANMDEKFVTPATEEYSLKSHHRAWLADSQGRDQYATYCADKVMIHWHGKPSQCEIAYERTDGKNWTDRYVAWSPLGSYFATLHHRGVRLWGGPTFEEVEKFAHPFVTLIDFSPCERYLVTWSHEPIVVGEGLQQGPRFFSPSDAGNELAIWEIKTGNLLRTFPMIHAETDDQSSKKQVRWPAFKWSADGNYVARMTPSQHISVYELPSMGLHGKKSLKIDGVADFSWAPPADTSRVALENHVGNKVVGGGTQQENMLAYWTPEMTNQPARVTLISFPSRSVLRQKNLFNVSNCQLHWQNQSDFLCVKVDRHTKTKKTLYCNLEIFRVREKDIPVEVIELKESVLEFSWEPKGERFAVISSSDPNLGNAGSGITVKTDVSFYQLDRGKGDFRLLRTLPLRTTNTIRWSPRGRFIVLATVGSSTKSELQFWDLDFHADDGARKEAHKEEWGNEIQLIGSADHYGVTDIEWEPSGRYLATSASAWTHQLENGYCIWDFRGQELEKHVLDRFKQFVWRPRPPTLLTKEQQRQIRKNLREYGRQFDEEDAVDETNVSAELLAHRKRLVDEWNTWRRKCKQLIADDHRKRAQPVNGNRISEHDVKEEIEVWVEELVEEIEEIVE
ncbi:translation initiation factor eIF-3b [Rickenella mellea]|uniref:Eukaryotic translation initiation factor 3 subunit B n=1 Tax=Rickenella mellea TaxID=50990 RepID=A0A4Y7PVT4_9AGAM|nr:translation initiation factor eIF-3b [Rickenella mellea]